jgi:acetolactate synthase-1/2/3 large subunit
MNDTNAAAITGQQYLAEALHAYGVTRVFMVPTALLRATAALDRLGVPVIMTHGEKAAAYMTDAYARASRRPGVCYAQNIGASNLAAGLRDAYMAGSPVIALTGGTNANNSYKTLYQQVDDLHMFDSVTKFNAVVEDVKRLPDLLRQAFRVATTGQPGPVHLRIPGQIADSLNATFERTSAHGPLSEPRFSQFPPFRPAPEPHAVKAALAALAQAKRPVLVVGGGVVSSGAQAEAVEFARKLSIPLLTSMNAKGTIDERDPLAIGVVGGYSRDSANRAVMEADLVFFIGSATGSQVTDGWRLPKMGSPVIQLDIDPERLGKHYPNLVSICADAKVGLRALIDAATPGPDRRAWCDTVAGYVKEWREQSHDFRNSDARPIRPERLSEEITRTLPDNGILLSDTGHSGIWTASMVDMRPGQSFLRCAGSLGWAFPAAIGAAMAAPDRPVVCFTGDGGFYYHLAELETAARYNANVTIVVNNNNALSQNTRSFQFAFDGKPTETGGQMWKFHDTDLAKASEALGCRAIRVDDPAQIAPALKEAMAIKGPVVLDVQGDPEALADPAYGGTDFYGNVSSKTAKK